MTMIFRDTFEDGDISEWTQTGSGGSAGTGTSSAPDGGSNHGYVAQNQGSGTHYRLYRGSFDWSRTYWFKFLVRSNNYNDSTFLGTHVGWRGDHNTSEYLSVRLFDTDSSGAQKDFRFDGDGVASQNSTYSYNWPTDGSWHWVKGKVDESTGTAYAKIWQAGNAEPSSWQAEASVSTGVASGPVTLYSNGKSSVDLDLDVARLEFATTEGELYGETTPPSAPSGVSATVDANDQITVSWTDNASSEDSFRVQVNRDGNGFRDLSTDANDPTPGANATSTTVVPDSDAAYDAQVGIDSSFQFRVRAENGAGSSDWATSGTVYTDPIPPSSPWMERPSADEFKIHYRMQTDVPQFVNVQYREDTGDGWSSWKWFDNQFPGNTKGAEYAPETYQVGKSYQADRTLQSDARYQWRIRSGKNTGGNGTSGNKYDYSEWVYVDYGNEGNVYFSDTFESGDTSAWDTATLSNDTHSGVHQGSVSGSEWTDLGIGGPAEGSHFLRLDHGDEVVKRLGDLSGESNVVVKLYVASGSNDAASEYASIDWYDGSSWQELRTFSHEYNKQGWVEVTVPVPSSYLSADNRLRLGRGGTAGTGDLSAFDRVIVSDVVDEYTSPTAPSNVSYDASVEDEITASYTRNATFGDTELKWNQVNESDGHSGHEEKRVSGGQGTITGLLDGEKYDVFARATINQYRHGSLDTYHTSDAGQTQITTKLPAPSNLAIDAQNGDQFDLSWTDNADNEDGYRVYRSRDGGSTWTQEASVGAGMTTYTTSNLRDGERYDFQVRAYTEHTESASSTLTATTALPDATGLSLDTGTEDEITASWTDAIDYGEYHVEYRESSVSSWTDWTTVGQGTNSTTITGLEDGEEYEVRVRSRTEHVTGDWTTGTATTVLPAVTDLSTGTPTRTEVGLNWTDNADDEDGCRVLRARKYDYGWGPWEEIADLGPNVTSYTDDTLSPGNTYKYEIAAHTEDETTESAETEAVTTERSGKPRVRTGSDRWAVKVEHQSGRSVRPQVLDEPTFRPTLNDYPRIEIPVPRDEKWQESGFEEAPLSVWKDGDVLPIDTLVDVRVEDDRTVLEGRGGSELAQRVQAEYDDVEAHVAVRNLVQNNTSYGTNVDDPASGTESDTKMQSASTTDEFERVTSRDSTDPYKVRDGRVEACQTNFPIQAQSADATATGSYYQVDGNATSDNSDTYGEAIRLEGYGDYVEVTFTPEYDVPAGSPMPYIRWGNPDVVLSDGHGLNLYVDGTDVSGAADGFGLASHWSWFTFSTLDWTLAGGTSHTVRIEVDSTASEDVYVDVLGLADDRFDYTWDEQVDSEQALAGPETHPDAVDVPFDSATSAYNVVGGRVDGTWTDTSNGQAVALSNDDGTTWTTSANTADFGTDFSATGSSVAWKATLGRYGSRDGVTPTTGYKSQSVESYTLYGDLKDTPVLDAQTYDGALVDVLNRIADYGNFVWELQRDQQDGWSVEWTQPGQRTADADDGIADYSVSKSVEKAYEKVVIKGAAQPVRGEEFTADAGNWVTLDRKHLVSATEIVRNPSDGATYELGTDYELDRSEGRIKVRSGGSMSDATTYEIDYRYKTQGSYTSKDAGSDPDTLVETVPSITSNRGCEQAALYLVQRLQDPVWEATVTIPKAEAGRSLVDELLLADLPTDGTRLEVREIEQTPSAVTMELGTRRSIRNLLDDLSNRVNSVADRV